jgi:predicted transcriptional regulator
MADRRPMGALEGDVLACLWNSTVAMSPGEVRDQLDQDLAYTTVATILVRLANKHLVSRERAGKVYLYRPVLAEADLAAQRMHDLLAKADNRKAVLSRFIDSLSTRETKALRQMLEDSGDLS